MNDDTYTRENRFAEAEFPEGWDEDDMEFLAQFLAENLDAELVRVVSDDDYDYDLYKRKKKTNTTKTSSNTSSTDILPHGFEPDFGTSTRGRADGGNGLMDSAQRRFDEE